MTKAPRLPKVEFDDTPYVRSHGKDPKGRGSWAFGPYAQTDCQSRLMIWTPSMTYSEAKRYARQQVAERHPDVTDCVLFVQS